MRRRKENRAPAFRKIGASALAVVLAASLSLPATAWATPEGDGEAASLQSDVAELAAQADGAVTPSADGVDAAELEAAVQAYDAKALEAQAAEGSQPAAETEDGAAPLAIVNEDVYLVEGQTDGGYYFGDLVMVDFHFTVSRDSIVAFRLSASGGSGSSYGLIKLKDASDNTLDLGLLWDGSRIQYWTLPAGSYTVQAMPTETSLSLHAQFDCVEVEGQQVFAPTNRSVEDAAAIRLNEPVMGMHFWAYNDGSDSELLSGYTYSFTLREPSRVEAVLSSFGTAIITLVDADGNVVRDSSGNPYAAATNGTSEEPNAAAVDFGLMQPGTYYVSVITSGDRDAWGHPFSFMVSATPGWADFSDVSMNHWYVTEGWLQYVVENGLISGYRDPATQRPTGLFGPDDAITRGQVAAILYRDAYPDSSATSDPAIYAGIKNHTQLRDNADGQFYTAALNWAYAEGIITGDKDPFTGAELYTARPSDPVNRQELATMLARYASTQGVSAAGDPAVYAAAPDAGSVLPYARETMAWCYEQGMLTGSKQTGELLPNDYATRAQAAKMVTVLVRDVIA